jgi:DNA helicase II / ATP-dependent DNA helicase PcrA
VLDVVIRRHPPQAWMERKLNAWARFCLRVQNADIAVKGQSYLALVDWSRPVFVVSNHQSYMDIPTVLVALNHKLGFVAKFELGRIPLLGYWMKQIGCLLIKRGKAGVGNQVNEAIRQMPHAPNLVIFPEGTRSRNGSLSPFKSGAFRMVTDHKGILIPLVIRGTRSVWENRSSEANKRYPLECEILEPVDCAVAISHKELMNQVRERMEVALGRTGSNDPAVVS